MCWIFVNLARLFAGMLLSNLLRAKTSKFQMPAASQLGSWPVLPSVPVLDSTRNYGVVKSSKFLQPDPQPAPPDFPMPVSTWSGRIVSMPAYPKDFKGVKVQKYFPFIEEISTQDGVVFKGKMSSSSLVILCVLLCDSKLAHDLLKYARPKNWNLGQTG